MDMRRICMKCPFPTNLCTSGKLTGECQEPSEAASIQCNTKLQSEKSGMLRDKSIHFGYRPYALLFFSESVSFNLSKELQADVTLSSGPEAILHKNFMK